MVEAPFRSQFALDIFRAKYAHEGCETWPRLARVIANDVMKGLMPQSYVDATAQAIAEMKFIPGGRYLYYAGRPLKAWNNCLLFRCQEDTREDWANLSHKVESALMMGSGVGVDYSIYRKSKSLLSRTGGEASGPVPKIMMINEIGRHVMQGGSRRSAIYASLDETHGDIEQFLQAKNWYDQVIPGTNMSLGQVKEHDFNFPAPLDMTNVSVNYKTRWLENYRKTGEVGEVFMQNVRQALRTGEPGFSFNFYDKENETLRNACTEVTSEDDSDICNLGSVNMSRIENVIEFAQIVELGTLFLLCGTLRADEPTPEVARVREKNRRLGLGLMGVHEWLLQRGFRYEMNDQLRHWLQVYRNVSDNIAESGAEYLSVSQPVARRAIAPTGTIGIMAGTTTGIEPLFAVSYKRRYLLNGTDWHYQYVVDSAAEELINLHGLEPDSIETALDLAQDPERRIAFQADVQDHVDMAISSTINLPAWAGDEGDVEKFAGILAKYAHRLRGFTCYPDGSRGGQPLTRVGYEEAKMGAGVTFKEHDSCKGGVCGL